MTVLITLTIAESDSGPFDLYTNVDGYKTPFAINISKTDLLAGYSNSEVPDNATTIKIQCTGTCTNYIYIAAESIPIPPVYEIVGCRSGQSFFAEQTYYYPLGTIVFFSHNNPINTGQYCGTIIGNTAIRDADITLLGAEVDDCGFPDCASDDTIIP